jgi:hypothetical protein
MIPAETIPGMGRGKGKRWREVNSRVMYLIHCKNFWKCHNVPPQSTIKNNLRNKKRRI